MLQSMPVKFMNHMHHMLAEKYLLHCPFTGIRSRFSTLNMKYGWEALHVKTAQQPSFTGAIYLAGRSMAFYMG